MALKHNKFILREECKLGGIWKQDPDANIWAQEGLQWEMKGLHSEELQFASFIWYRPAD